MEEDNQQDDSYDKDEVIQQLMNKIEASEANNLKLNTALSSADASQQQGSNLVQYQLDTTTMLDNLRNFYSGRYESYDEDGNIVMKTPDDDELIPLNEFGVNSLMEIISKYIDKNTTLSYYDEMRIYEILADLGDEICLFIFCNYEKMGMDTHFKKTKFRVLILTTLHMIESTYRRSLRGQTSNDLNQSKIVTQSDNIGMRLNQQIPMQQNKGFQIPNPFKRF